MACIVWKCPRPSSGRGLCARHDAETPQGPTTTRTDPMADLMDPAMIDADLATHRASLATNVLLDALRP